MLDLDLDGLRQVVGKELTILWHDLEQWQRDNPAILSGYRPESGSYSASIASLFYLHNESVNIWSHLLGSVAFGFTAPILYRKLKGMYRTATAGDMFAFGCFFAGCVFCLGMSGVFHLLSNHSAAVQRWGNQLDYMGIVFLIWGSFVSSIYFGFQEKKDLIRIYWTMITIIGFGTAYASVSPTFRKPNRRPIRAGLFVSMGFSVVLPIVHGLLIFGYSYLNRLMALNWMFLEGSLYIFGAGLYAARIPERFLPGRFDQFFASHQIFHFLVLAASTVHLLSLVQAFHYKHRNPDTSNKSVPTSSQLYKREPTPSRLNKKISTPSRLNKRRSTPSRLKKNRTP